MYDFKDPYGKKTEYIPPSWCKELRNIPTHKVNLIMGMTPIHRWHLPVTPHGMKIYIKRDDMTGSVLGGNKVRKLEFQFAEALRRGCGSYLKCGNMQSNECRTIAVVAAQLGLKTYFLLRKSGDTILDTVPSGNYFIMNMCGATMIFFPQDSNYEKEIFPKKKLVADAIFEKTGKPCFIDGRVLNSIAIHGYLGVWEELLQQGVIAEIDDIVVPASSGVSVSGLAVGNYLTGSRVKIHGVATRKSERYFYEVVDDLLQDINLTEVSAEDIVDIIDGYQYKDAPDNSVEDIMQMTKEIASTTGVICDPTYGGKAVTALTREFSSNRHRFKGNRILYIHTGGIFSLFDRGLPSFQKENHMSANWQDVEQSLYNFV